MPDPRLRALVIFGTRPEAVKMAPVVARLKETAQVSASVCVTAQHREMLDQVLHLFDIRPDYDLDLMQPGQSLPDLTAAVFSELGTVIEASQPDWILIQGDTTTVMAAALLGYYHRVKVGHVEAGLRTGDKWRPFPEEINRRVAAVVADLHFAPTQTAKVNLLREGIPEKKVVVTGNPVIDALQKVVRMPYDVEAGPLAGIPWDRNVLLVTAHRREHFGEPLKKIFAGLKRIAEAYPRQVHLVYPVHLNPNVQGPAHETLGQIPNVTLLEPLDYQPMVRLLERSYLVLTDSGGLQEEAPALGTPVLVMRETTERPEAIEAGVAALVGTDGDRIFKETKRLLDQPEERAKMARAVNPFGDGKAAERIVHSILAYEPEPGRGGNVAGT
jgi:UDP-N-acetylglucosamine 2-epimerase (non-hydrolysing)